MSEILPKKYNSLSIQQLKKEDQDHHEKLSTISSEECKNDRDWKEIANDRVDLKKEE